MLQTLHRSVSALVVLVVTCVFLVGVAPRVSGQVSTAFPNVSNGEWPTYNADVKGSR